MIILYSYITFFIIFFYANNIIFSQIKELKTITVPNSKGYADFTLVHNKKNNSNYIVFLTVTEDESRIVIFNRSYNLVYEKSFNESLATLSWSSGSNNNISKNNYFYLISKNYIYQLDIVKMKIDSFRIKNNNYINLKNVRHLYPDRINSEKVLIFDYEKGVDIYSINPFSLIHTFNKEFHDKGYGSKPILINGNIIYINKKNEIICRDLSTGKKKWSYSTGETDIGFLGIDIGSAENSITEYVLAKNHQSLLVCTMTGNIISINVEDGSEIIKVENFAGDDLANYAGKINYISQADVNKDNIVDFILSSSDNNIYCLNGTNLNILWNIELEDKSGDPTSEMDITGDSVPEIFLTNNSKLYILNGINGKILFQKKILSYSKNDDSFIARVILCDFNNNEKLDIITLASANEIKIFEMDNVKVPKGIIVGTK